MSLPYLLGVFSLKAVIAWDYAENGADWKSEGQCASGGPQSPIALPGSASVEKKEKLFLKYPTLGGAKAKLYNNGYSIALTLPESFKAGFGIGEKLDDFESEDASAFRLWQVNFHSPSEHTLKGQRLPLEMQMMHQRVTGGKADTAVVVVLFSDAANAFHEFFSALQADGMPSKTWEEKVLSQPLEFAKVVGGAPFFKYMGSLTVPPCETHVKYLVRQEPIPVSHGQLQQFRSILEDTCKPRGNYRLTHPLKSYLILMPSVDVENKPDEVVKPPPKPLEDVVPPPKPGTKSYECSLAYLDREMKQVGRVRVGESDELTHAKQRYNEALRDVQISDNAIAASRRNAKLQQKLYDDAPGWAEKIKQKWNVDTSKSVAAGAVYAAPKFGTAYAKASKVLYNAIIHQCVKEMKEKEKKKPKPPPSKAEKKVEGTDSEGLPAKEPWTYPAPVLALPTGLGASPFKSGTDAESGTGDSADGPGATGSMERIAPNLHQPDMPASSSTVEAEKETKDVAPDGPPDAGIVMKVDFPVPATSVVDDFKTGLVDALSKSGDVTADRLEVLEVHDHAVAKVHSTKPETETVLAQLSSGSASQQHRAFLRRATSG